MIKTSGEREIEVAFSQGGSIVCIDGNAGWRILHAGDGVEVVLDDNDDADLVFITKSAAK